MWTSMAHCSINFSNASHKFKRAFNINDKIMYLLSYLHAFELHTQIFDKLLRVLKPLEWVPLILTMEGCLML